jgi:hypothetical protein
MSMYTHRGVLGPLVAMLSMAAVGLVLSGCGIGARSGIGAAAAGSSASAQQKKDARAALDEVIGDLQELDAAYASGDAAEAHSDLGKAKADWRKVVPAATVQDQSDIQIKFDRLDHSLSSKAPAQTVSDSIRAFVAELHHDVAPGLS